MWQSCLRPLLRPRTPSSSSTLSCFAGIVPEIWVSRLVSASCTPPPLPLKPLSELLVFAVLVVLKNQHPGDLIALHSIRLGAWSLAFFAEACCESMLVNEKHCRYAHLHMHHVCSSKVKCSCDCAAVDEPSSNTIGCNLDNPETRHALCVHSLFLLLMLLFVIVFLCLSEMLAAAGVGAGIDARAGVMSAADADAVAVYCFLFSSTVRELPEYLITHFRLILDLAKLVCVLRTQRAHRGLAQVTSKRPHLRVATRRVSAQADAVVLLEIVAHALWPPCSCCFHARGPLEDWPSCTCRFDDQDLVTSVCADVSS